MLKRSLSHRILFQRVHEYASELLKEGTVEAAHTSSPVTSMHEDIEIQNGGELKIEIARKLLRLLRGGL